MNELERLWRGKTDEELTSAGGHIRDYTAEAQAVIRRELERRNLQPRVEEDALETLSEDDMESVDENDGEEVELDSDADESGLSVESEAGVVDCLRCNSPMDYLGTKRFHEGANWGVLGELGEWFVKKESFDLYVCPRCGKVELFVNGIGEDYRPH